MTTELIQKANELLQQNNLKGAIQCFQQLIKMDPDNQDYIMTLTVLYEGTMQFDKAYETFQQIWDSKSGKLKDESHAGAAVYAKAGEYAYFARMLKPAIQNLKKSIELKPDNPGPWCFLGRCHSSEGDSKAAKKSFEEAIAINPKYFPAYYYLSRISGFTKDDPVFAQLEGYKEDLAMHSQIKSDLGFALGRLYQNAGDYDKSFENFSYGNTEARKQSLSLNTDINPDTHQKNIDLITTLYTPENRKQIGSKGSTSTKPVFIVGLQRSGTTLLEQILAAHSEISSAGELVQLAGNHLELLNWIGRFKESDQLSAFLKAMDQRSERMTNLFLESLLRNGEETPYIIDKLPQNYMQLGIIEILFPEAKIIHIRRDPMDVGLSIYASQFSSDLSFAQDLADIGFYIKEYNRLMTFWQTALDIPIHEVEYESLVNEPETVVRGILEFCGLDWQPECLEFYKTPGKVFTSSVMQVRNPINTSAIGRWKHYKKHLEPLKKALEQ